MLILAVDTSSETLSVALLEEASIRTEVFVNSGLNHSRMLLPTINKAYDLANRATADTDLFVCTVGPGSFTGLRTGVCTIKGLAMATGKPMVALSTLEALTANAGPFNKSICPLVDAGRGNVYAAVYRMVEDSLPQLIGCEIVTDIDQFLSSVDGEALFLGSGALKYADKIRIKRPDAYIAHPQDCSVRAGRVGLLGRKYFHEGITADVLAIAPRYILPSEPERNLMRENILKARNVDKLL